eukprot:scaffold59661_cov65-Cyclotella_meneghiniana.AAC.3
MVSTSHIITMISDIVIAAQRFSPLLFARRRSSISSLIAHRIFFVSSVISHVPVKRVAREKFSESGILRAL